MCLLGLAVSVVAAAAPLEPDAGRVSPEFACHRIAAARAYARQHLDRGDPASAYKVLETFRSTCRTSLRQGSEERPNLQHYWLHSDLAALALRSGDPVRCLQILGPLTVPMYSPLTRPPLDGSRVARAIHHTARKCERAHETQYSAFKHAPCELEVDGASRGRAVRVPPEAVSADAEEACLVITSPHGEEDARQAVLSGATIPDEKLCPSVQLTTRSSTGQISSRTIGNLATFFDPTDCCRVQPVSVALDEEDGVLVRMVGEGRDCFGGTAISTINALGRIRTGTFEPVETTIIRLH